MKLSIFVVVLFSCVFVGRAFAQTTTAQKLNACVSQSNDLSQQVSALQQKSIDNIKFRLIPTTRMDSVSLSASDEEAEKKDLYEETKKKCVEAADGRPNPQVVGFYCMKFQDGAGMIQDRLVCSGGCIFNKQ